MREEEENGGGAGKGGKRRPRTPGGGFRLLEAAALQAEARARKQAAKAEGEPKKFVRKAEVVAVEAEVTYQPASRRRASNPRPKFVPRGTEAIARPLPRISEWVDGLGGSLGETGAYLNEAEKRAILSENAVWADGLLRRSARAAGYQVSARVLAKEGDGEE